MNERDMLDLWAKQLPDRRVIEDFLGWLSERKIELAEWRSGARMLPAKSTNDLLNEYHGIDYWRLEAQRRALLETLSRD
jgi:hypothetical protein